MDVGHIKVYLYIMIPVDNCLIELNTEISLMFYMFCTRFIKIFVDQP